MEEVIVEQRPNDEKEPALERVGLEGRGTEHGCLEVTPGYHRNRQQLHGWSLAMEKVAEAVVRLGRSGRGRCGSPGEEFGFQGHWMGTEHCCL